MPVGGYLARCKLAGGALFAVVTIVLSTAPAVAITQPYYSEIIMTAANFCPVGWLPADGRPLPIADNDALFSLIGVTYGGDGETTFNLPMIDPIRSASGMTLLPCIAVTGIYPSQN